MHAWVASCTVGCSPCACNSEGLPRAKLTAGKLVLEQACVFFDRVLMCYHLCKVGELVVLQKACVNNLWKLVC